MTEKIGNEIIRNLPVALFVVDDTFRVKYLNPRFSEMFDCEGCDSTEVGRLIGCKTLMNGGVCTAQPECSLCMLRQALSDCIAKGRQVYKKLIEKKVIVRDKPHTLNLKVTITPMEDGDFICMADDVTEIIELSDGEKKLNRQLMASLKKARHIQRDLLPQRSGMFGVKFDYIYRQLEQVGGDFFDVFAIDADRTGFYIADVSGHGMPGGMLTVFLKENYNKTLLSPREALEELYLRFNRYRFSEETYITVFSAVWDRANGVLTYANAGHNVPALLEREGSVTELTAPGAPISNWFLVTQYQDHSVFAPSGSRILLTTDGLTDLKRDGVEFGLGPLKDSLIQRGELPSLCGELARRAEHFTGTAGDDIAALVVEL